MKIFFIKKTFKMKKEFTLKFWLVVLDLSSKIAILKFKVFKFSLNLISKCFNQIND